MDTKLPYTAFYYQLAIVPGFLVGLFYLRWSFHFMRLQLISYSCLWLNGCDQKMQHIEIYV